MSLDAIRWALDQSVEKPSIKFVLVVMADCVNAEGGEVLCWPSYAFLSKRTGLNVKTVESAVYDLRTGGLIVDTGKRRGDTGKVVVYRLNTTKTGGISQGPQEPPTGGNDESNAPKSGGITPPPNPPTFSGNPPKSGEQSPQNMPVIPPKVGVRTGKKQERTGKEPGRALTSIPGVPAKTFDDWMVARKRIPVTGSVIAALEREADKAGLTVAEAVIFCAESSWRGFNAGWYAERMKAPAPRNNSRAPATGKYAAAARTIFGQQPDYIDAETN